MSSETQRGVVDETHVEIVPRRNIGRIVANVIIAVFAFGVVWVLITNPRFQWGVVAEYLTAPAILSGFWVTIQLTFIAMVLGTAIGVIVATLKLADNRWLRGAANTYIWFFRGIPLLVQLILWFNISALFPNITFGIPGGPVIATLDGNAITPFMAAVIGLTLHEAAYMAEIVRGGILAVPKGQRLAALALGMTRPLVFMRITLPQAARVIAPATGNQVILMLKTTSLVSVIALQDLLYSAQTIYARTFEIIPLLIVASIWYLMAVSVLSLIQRQIERHFGRGYS